LCRSTRFYEGCSFVPNLTPCAVRTPLSIHSFRWVTGGRARCCGHATQGHYATGQSFEKLKSKFAPDVGFHHFRKTTATSLRRNGVDPGVIDAILGWAARNVQDRYYVAVVDADLHKAILKLYADDPLGI